MLQTGKYGIQNDGWLAGLVAKSCRTLVTSWTIAHQASLSLESSSFHGILQEEYWNGLPYMVYKTE